MTEATTIGVVIMIATWIIAKAIEGAAKTLGDRIANLAQATFDHTEAMKRLEWERQDRE